MDAIAALTDLARRPLHSAEHLRAALTGPDAAEKLNAHPGAQDNSIAWLLWHSGREIDAQVAHLSGGTQAWTEQGFVERFALAVDPADHGYGHTAEQARSVKADSFDLLMEYLTAAVESQVAYIRTLSEEQLDEIIDTNFTPHVSRGTRLISMTEDALQHIGQAAYALGVMK